jgi:hypothetical protein
MARKLRRGKATDVADVIQAIVHLAAARDHLKRVGAARTVVKVRRALKSAGGALRHADRTTFDLAARASHGR